MGNAKRRKQIDPTFGTGISRDGFLKVHGVAINGVRKPRSKNIKYFPCDFIFFFPDRQDLRATGIAFSQTGAQVTLYKDSYSLKKAVDEMALLVDPSIGNYEMVGSKDFIEIKLDSCPAFNLDGSINFQYLSGL